LRSKQSIVRSSPSLSSPGSFFGGRSPWLTFILPWSFLGLGLLAKGPAHLFFFYALVIAILWQNRRLRDLIHPAHAIAILIMLGIFFLWAIPYFRALHFHSPLQVWSHETMVAIHGEEGRSEDWSLHFPRGFAYFLPWVLLVPFIRPHRIADPISRRTARGILWGMITPFVVVLLIPGTLPRYVLPLMAPFCWLIGLAIRDAAFSWKLGPLPLSRRLAFSCIVIDILAAMVIYPLRSVTYLKRHERIKPIAARVNSVLPPGVKLYAIDLDYQPFLFYLHNPITYLATFDQLPGSSSYFLLEPKYERKLEATQQWIDRHPKLLLHTEGYSRHEAMLFVTQP